MACPRCGTALPEAARFCPNCGFSLAEALREERRVVTVLFGDLSGFTEMSERLDAEEVKGIVDRAFEGLAEVVTLYGGRVDKIIGDEIMAVFGAPQAHEDDPERAVRAGLEMQRQLVRFSRDLERDRGVKLRMRVGINTGEVVAGLVAGGDTYSVLGDAVNTAKRIEAATEAGQILVGEATYLATASSIEYREHELVVAKGKQDPLRVWEAIAERALPGTAGHHPSEAPLVGRDEELTVLDGLARIVKRDRRTFVVTITGDAGMGKSRLADELARRLEPHGARVIAGRSLPYGTASPWFALEEIVREALGVDPGAQPDAARARVGEQLVGLGLGADAQRVLGLLRMREPEPAAVRTIGGSGPTGGGPTGGSGTAQAARGSESAESALALLQALAAREELLVLAFHEMHWAEDPLLDFVAALAERTRGVPLLVLCLARNDLVERRPAWAGRPGSVLLPLEPLPLDRAAALLDVLLGGQTLHPALRDSVLERAGGNPFYIEELVRLLIDQQAQGVRPGAMAVPGSVQGIVTARLDGLPPEAKRLVQSAAVVGDQFWPGALTRLEPDLAEGEIASLLGMLADKELVEPVAVPRLPDQPEWRFRQAIVREVAYSSIPKQTRARNHAEVGGWLEDVTCECGLEREFFDLVAHHYERAAVLAREVGAEVPGAASKAREYLERAGDQALGLDAAAAAAEFFERALPFAADETDRLHLRLHLGEALVGCWRPVEAEAHLNAVLEEAKRTGQLRAEGKAMRLLGDLLRIRGEVERARPLLERGLEIAKQVGDVVEEVEGLRSHGLADMFQGKVPAAALWFRQSLARSRDIGDRRSEGWSLMNLAWANMILGRFEETAGYIDEAAKLFGDMGDAEGIGWSVGLRAWITMFQGRLREADEMQVELEKLIVSSTQPSAVSFGGFGLAIGHTLRAIIALARGRLGDAERFSHDALAVFDDTVRPWGSAMGRYPLGMVATLRRQFDEAREILERAIHEAELAGDALVLALTEFTLALSRAEAGDVDGAELWGRKAWEHTERSGVEWLRDIGLRALYGRIHAMRGRTAEARRVLAEAARFPSRGLSSRSMALAELAELMCEEGEAAEAIPIATEAAESAGEDVVGRAHALRALARARAGTGMFAEAEAALREELLLLEDTDWDQEKVIALARLAEVLGALGRSGEAAAAVALAREALDRFPPGADLGPLEEVLGLRR